jgi:hypothetical protein
MTSILNYKKMKKLKRLSLKTNPIIIDEGLSAMQLSNLEIRRLMGGDYGCGALGCAAQGCGTASCGGNGCAGDACGADTCAGAACGANVCGGNACGLEVCPADACIIDVV